MNDPRSREADLQRIATPQATFLLPGKHETRHAGHCGPEEGGGLLSLLFQDPVDGYGALFLSNS
jgi:hypothetical protein